MPDITGIVSRLHAVVIPNNTGGNIRLFMGIGGKMRTTKVKIKVSAMLLLCMSLGGCNTMEGLGTDIKKGGAAIERAADSNKPS